MPSIKVIAMCQSVSCKKITQKKSLWFIKEGGSKSVGRKNNENISCEPVLIMLQ